MSMPLIPPFAVAASYQNSQYATSPYTQGGSQVFSHLVSPPASGVAAEEASDDVAEAVGWVTPTAHDEVQHVTLTNATSGTFTLSYSGTHTAPIAFDASTSAVHDALVALTSIGTGNVAVTGVAGAWIVTFQGALADEDVPLLGINVAGLNAPVVTVSTVTPGVAVANEVQLVTVTATGGTFKLTYSGQQTSAINFDETAVNVQAALVALSNIAPGDVIVTAPGAGGPYTCSFAGALAATDLTQMTVDASSLTGPSAGAVVTTQTPGTAGTNEVQHVDLTHTTGGTFTLTYSGQQTSAIAFNASTTTVSNALVALSNIAGGDVAVTGAAGGWIVTFQGALAHTNVSQLSANSTSLTNSDVATGVVTQTTAGVEFVNQALLNTTRQFDGMRSFYDSASGNHF